MTAKEILKKISEGQTFNIIDIRSDIKYNTYHLPKAINIIPGEMLASPDKFIVKGVKYYIACNSGNSAGMVSKDLSNKGYDIESIEGGMSTIKN